MLQHPRARDGAVFGHVPDQEHRCARLLGQAQQAPGGLTHLAHAARRRAQIVAVERLHGVHHDQLRALLVQGGHHRLQLRLGQYTYAARGGADAFGTHADLRRRLLATDEQNGPLAGNVVEHLQKQRALAYAGLAPDQHQ